MKEVSQNDVSEKLELFIKLAECFNKTYSKQAVQMMLKALRDMTVKELEFAVEKSIQESTWMPAIANLWIIINEKRLEDTQKLAQKVISWLIKNTSWDFSQQAVQEDVDRALVVMGLEPGSIKASDV